MLSMTKLTLYNLLAQHHWSQYDQAMVISCDQWPDCFYLIDFMYVKIFKAEMISSSHDEWKLIHFVMPMCKSNFVQVV